MNNKKVIKLSSKTIDIMKQKLTDLLILNLIFGSFWLFALIYFTS